MTDPGDDGVARLLAIADDLYGLPTGEFTAARDARARELKGTSLAPRVKALRRPSTAAWVVDLLVRREAEQVQQLLHVGAALREAQAAMSAGELRELTRQRRQVTAALTTRARGTAAAEGTRVTEAVAAQVEATLTAAMLDVGCARAVASGLLVAPLHTTGIAPLDDDHLVAALALPEALGHVATPAQAAASRPAALHVVPDPEADAKRVAAAQGRLDEAESRHARALAARDDARADRDRVASQTLQIEAEIDELRRRLADLEEQAEGLEEEQAEAEEALDVAGADLRTAAAERDAALAALERLRSRASTGGSLRSG